MVQPLPCSFRVVVHEASNVPIGVRGLEVSWRKGVQVESTGLAEVTEGRVQWGRSLCIKCPLFRKALMHDGKPQFESKLTWFAVKRDDGEVLGHAGLDLAEFCDFTKQERTLQVGGRGLGSGLRLRVSVEASGATANNVRTAGSHYEYRHMATGRTQAGTSEPIGHIGMLGSDLTVGLAASLGHAETLSQLPQMQAEGQMGGVMPIGSEIEALLRSHQLSPGTLTPRPSAVNLGELGRQFLLAQSLAPSRPRSEGATSRFASSFADLPSRLVALCNRQCEASGLSAVEQEDAILLFIAALRKSREPPASCGLLFSTASPRASTTAYDADTGAPAEAAPAGGGSSASSAAERAATAADGQPTSSEYQTVATLPAMPSVPEAGWISGPLTRHSETAAAAAVDGSAHACTKHLYELLSHLSDIKSLALALLQRPGARSHDEEASMQDPLTPSRALAKAAATFAAAAAVESDPQAAFQSSPECVNPAGPGEALSAATAAGPFPSAAEPPAGMLQPRTSNVTASLYLDAVVSQIIMAVDQAASIGEAALQQACEELGCLLLRLNEVSQDRELWAQRFLANRELQRAGLLCDRVLQLAAGSKTLGPGWTPDDRFNGGSSLLTAYDNSAAAAIPAHSLPLLKVT
eukprot:TRINITY_DN39629_c0_g1_i1.p1 TRINITY_DN39629_c0_g1~~TRINITY_DN39629_c0_g1_i1.p1  ORF type:complete len:655 (-),score=102.79 TRINITY_DN39629_c0_g1_i1:141-2051(-)